MRDVEWRARAAAAHRYTGKRIDDEVVLVDQPRGECTQDGQRVGCGARRET